MTWLHFKSKALLGITGSRNIIKIYNLNFIKNIHTVSKYKIMGTKGKKNRFFKRKILILKNRTNKNDKKSWGEFLKKTFALLKF